MYQTTMWQTEPDGILASDAGAYRLVVRSAGGMIRFSVLQRIPGDRKAEPMLVLTGTESTARAAMAAAERGALRCAASGSWPAAMRRARDLDLCEGALDADT